MEIVAFLNLSNYIGKDIKILSIFVLISFKFIRCSSNCTSSDHVPIFFEESFVQDSIEKMRVENLIKITMIFDVTMKEKQKIYCPDELMICLDEIKNQNKEKIRADTLNLKKNYDFICNIVINGNMNLQKIVGLYQKVEEGYKKIKVTNNLIEDTAKKSIEIIMMLEPGKSQVYEKIKIEYTEIYSLLKKIEINVRKILMNPEEEKKIFVKIFEIANITFNDAYLLRKKSPQLTGKTTKKLVKKGYKQILNAIKSFNDKTLVSDHKKLSCLLININELLNVTIKTQSILRFRLEINRAFQLIKHAQYAKKIYVISTLKKKLKFLETIRGYIFKKYNKNNHMVNVTDEDLKNTEKEILRIQSNLNLAKNTLGMNRIKNKKAVQRVVKFVNDNKNKDRYLK